jgi:hypothetical protein
MLGCPPSFATSTAPAHATVFSVVGNTAATSLWRAMLWRGNVWPPTKQTLNLTNFSVGSISSEPTLINQHFLARYILLLVW